MRTLPEKTPRKGRTRGGDTRYEELEEAFANAQAGDTITVLKDCSVSGTLEVTLDNITLQSEDAGTIKL